MNIHIARIDHSGQRYETAGDWWFDNNGDLQIRVSDMGSWQCEALVAFHELAEVLLCKERGISQESVDAFDKDFEAARKPGNEDEPGDDPAAPYHREHFFATTVERLLAAELGVDWEDYEEAICKL